VQAGKTKIILFQLACGTDDDDVKKYRFYKEKQKNQNLPFRCIYFPFHRIRRQDLHPMILSRGIEREQPISKYKRRPFFNLERCESCTKIYYCFCIYKI